MARALPLEFRTTRPKRDDEAVIQRALVRHLELYAYPDAIWHMIDNGSNKSKAAAGWAKAMGLRAGVYDLGGAVPGGHAWYLELKKLGGRLSEKQVDFGELAERNGAYHFVAYTLDDALAWLTAIGVLKEIG